MSTHDSITRLGQGPTWRAPWRLAWHLLRACAVWRPGAARRVRVGRRERRRLSAIECALVAETPQLAAMFQMFDQLAVGESHDGAERLTRSPRSRRRPVLGPLRAHVALLIAFASIVALCVTLSFRVHPGQRTCLGPTTTSSTSPGTSRLPAFRAAGAAAAFAPVRMPGCRAYPTYSK